MDKIHSLLQDLRSAFVRLQETQTFPSDQAYKDATIQRFEFTFELAWKLMQAVCIENGLTAYGPRNAIRSSAQLELISDVSRWLEFLKYRNLTTHMYKQEVADEVLAHVSGFIPLVEELIECSEKQE